MGKSASSQVLLSKCVMLIVGGAQGIGATAVEIFVNAGAKVVFADMNATGGKATEAKVNGLLFEG